MNIKARIPGYGTGFVTRYGSGFVFECKTTKVFFKTEQDLVEAGHELELRLTGSQAHFFLNAFKEAKNDR